MKKIAIITDSNSGITQEQGRALDITVIPMPFCIAGKEYLEDISLSQKEFYEMLANGDDISTSQPAVGVVLNFWDELLEQYDQIVHIPMSSGLSKSCHTAIFLAKDYEDKVFVVDNQRISLTLRQSVLEAISLAKAGKDGREIKELLEKTKYQSSIYITVDTLKYLRKGGRVTAAGAALGALLKIKPVLQIQGEKLDAFAKCRGMKSAKRTMIEAAMKDIKERFSFDGRTDNIHIEIAHTQNEEEANNFKQELLEIFPNYDIYVDNLSLSISCHIGPGALAVAITKTTCIE